MTDYDTILQQYDASSEQMEAETREKFYDILPDLNGMDLLDIGCGSGIDAGYYISQGATVWGVDISQRSVDKAQKQFPTGKFIQEDMKHLSFQDEQFDIVVSWYAFQATNDLNTSLQEAFRVTKKGGTVAMLVKHPFRSMLEGYSNDGETNYFSSTVFTSKIFNEEITLREPHHTVSEYLMPQTNCLGALELFQEGNDMPASQRALGNLHYPTFIILKWRKK